MWMLNVWLTYFWGKLEFFFKPDFLFQDDSLSKCRSLTGDLSPSLCPTGKWPRHLPFNSSRLFQCNWLPFEGECVKPRLLSSPLESPQRVINSAAHLNSWPQFSLSTLKTKRLKKDENFIFHCGFLAGFEQLFCFKPICGLYRFRTCF